MKIKFYKDKCINCGMCVVVCPHRVFLMKADEAGHNKELSIAMEKDCIECGACQMNCPVGAIQIDTGVG
ncbi:4Fe-4S binding protein [Fusibacter sp. JL216-2]|uniref:4Fe-4S binding protein n=1 Tax=Fusibacter sp. JL216-2 TaxID=3071453 RepID=UPI003D329092